MNRALDGQRDLEDWAGAVTVNVISDYWQDRLKLGLTAFTGQKLLGVGDKGDTGLLQPGHHGYSGLSEAYASFTIDQLALKAGRYTVQIPYLNGADIRLLPQAFQGFHGIYQMTESWSVVGGMLTDIKDRTSTGFDPLYRKAGLNEEHNVSGIGSIIDPGNGNLAGLYIIHAPEFMNNLYLELSKRFALTDKEYWQLAAQYTHQRSTGRQLDGEFKIDHLGIRISWRRSMVQLSAAYTYYSDYSGQVFLESN